MYLLSATFDINGRHYEVMIDTGATISCLPEHGDIIQHAGFRPEKTNVLVKMANGRDEHMCYKTKAYIRPTQSTVQPRVAQFYVLSGAKDIFGYQALIGLKQLKLFDLNIVTKDDKIIIYHQNKIIGQESVATAKISAGAKIIDKITPVIEDANIRHILRKYKSIFSDLNGTPIRGKPMRFFTVHQHPIFAKQRNYNTDEVLAMRIHIKTLLDQGIIEPTNSGYAATSKIIPKKNGTGRLVINYIPLNNATYRDSYALPHISDILGAIQENRYFTTMDCTQGFYQIDVDARDRHKTAFSTPIGSYQFRRCPFGAKNSCAVFQAEMNRIFFEGLYKRCVVYVDDILIFGKDRREHDENLEWVLKQCSTYNVKIKLEKCNFAVKEVDYLGFRITGTSISPIRAKVDSISKSQHPRDKTELKSLIGKLNFYSRFIPYYSSKLEPLRSLLTKNKDFQWKDYHQEAFESLIHHLDKAESHQLVSRKAHKIISIHISNNSIETILTDNNDTLISRMSRLLSTTESNYSWIEKQIIGLVFAIKKFKLLLEPEHFTVKVPDNTLEKTINLVNRPERVDQWLIKLPPGFDTIKFTIDESMTIEKKKQNKLHLPEEIFYIDGACRSNGKPNCKASWAVCSEYDREMELKGLVTTNPSNQSAELTAAIKACEEAKRRGLKEITIVTDSKYLFSAATLWIDKWKNNEWKDHKNKPVINVDLFKQLLYGKEGLEIEWTHVKGHSGNAGNIRADLLAKSMLDSKAETLNTIISSQIMIQQDNSEIDELKQQIEEGTVNNLRVIDDVVYHIDPKLPEGSNERIYVPKDSRYWLLNLAHDDIMYGGHLGIKKTYRKLTRFWWPQMHNEVESYVKSCDTCQRFKNPSGLPPGYLHSIPVSKVFEHLHIDIIGPLKTTFRGHSYVITATDAFSKWAFATPSQNVRTSEVIKFVEDQILSVHGKPQVIITDRGTQFTSGEWKEFINKMKIKHNLTTPYHPQSNGIDERLNGTLMRILRAYVDEYQENWDEHLKWSLYIYNTTVHESTGYSPYQVLHGMDSRSPLKPTNIVNANESIIDLNTCDNIREDVCKRIKLSQENQRKHYDKRHSKHKLYIGQFVYTRIHAPPSQLSRKFYSKWQGPYVITGFVGDTNNPKAVCILDFKNLIKKVVAIQDVKPSIDSFVRPNTSNETQKDDGHALSSSSSDSRILNDPSFYVNYEPETSHKSSEEHIVQNNSDNTPQASQRNNEADLNFNETTFVGPYSSTPRRVTISNDIETRVYQPQEATISSRYPQRVRTQVASESMVPLNQNTVYDYDCSRIDPTYKPTSQVTPKPVLKQTDTVGKQYPKLSTRSRIPYYISRPQTRTSTQTTARQSSDSSSNQQTSSNPSTMNNTYIVQSRQSSSNNLKSREEDNNNIASLVDVFKEEPRDLTEW